MCRFLVYFGLNTPILLEDLLSNPSHSIIRQSFDAKERKGSPLNGDGFGVAWYTDEHPTSCIFTSTTPAWSNRSLLHISQKVKSSLVFAHVRAASPGSFVTEANCHPFQYGKITWMHNGNIGEFDRIKRALIGELSDEFFQQIHGTTDSEHSFMLFMTILVSKLHANDLDPVKEREILDSLKRTKDSLPTDLLRETMIDTIKRLEYYFERYSIKETSLLNFCVTDGHSVIATRYVSPSTDSAATLYFASGTHFAPATDSKDKMDYRMYQSGKLQRCHIISSEPLSPDLLDWVSVPTNHMLVITKMSNLLIFPFN